MDSAQKLTISGWSIGGDFKIVSTTCPLTPSTLPAGQSCTFQVSFQPQNSGRKNEVLRVTDGAPNSPQKVQLQGVGQR